MKFASMTQVCSAPNATFATVHSALGRYVANAVMPADQRRHRSVLVARPGALVGNTASSVAFDGARGAVKFMFQRHASVGLGGEVG